MNIIGMFGQKSGFERRSLAYPVIIALLIGIVPARAQTFYPQPPDPPRIQLLKKFHSEADIRGEPSWFMRFLFGRQIMNQWLRKAIDRPYSVVFNNDMLLVSDSGSGSYWQFDFEEETLELAEDPPGRAGIQSGLGLAVDDNGNVLVSDTARKEILLLETGGRLLARFGTGLLERPAGLAVDKDSVFVCDAGNNSVIAFSLDDGASRSVIGDRDKNTSPLGGPTNVALAPDGSLYISETLAGRVTHFGRDGSLISTVGSLGVSYGSFGAPKGLAIDRDGLLYVADARYEHVQIFDSEGRVLMVFGLSGDPETDLSLPAGIAIDYESVPYWQKYAADGFNLEYVIAVVRQFEPAAVYIYGYGRMSGVQYPEDPPPR